MEKTPEEIQEDTWIENPELWTELRQEFLDNELAHETEVNSDYTWEQLGEDAMETANEKWDADTEEERTEQIQFYAAEWIQNAKETIGINPSGQANFLAATLEHTIYDNATAGRMNNTGHHTVLLHLHDENQTYHVETGRVGRTAHPPGEANFPHDNPDDTPLWETENNLDRAETTLKGMAQLKEWDDSWQNVDTADDFLVDSMAALREDQESVPEFIGFLHELGLTSELSPEIDYEVSGTADSPEVTPAI